MTTIGWIILLVLLVPALGILVWVILGESFVRIPSGRLALVLRRGRPTDRTLLPGVHFIPALRRRTVEIYPAVELSYRAGGTAQPVDQPGLDGFGPPVEVFLGDRTRALLGYTVRYRLLPAGLRVAHERFGPSGLMPAVRDQSADVVTAVLGSSQVTVDDLFAEARESLQQTVSERLTDALAEDGMELMAFALRSIDLGRTGEAIQALARAPHELAQEQATASVRAAAAENDAALRAAQSDDVDSWRYRETDLWRELILRRELLNVSLASGVRVGTPPPGDAPPPAPTQQR